MHDLPHHYTVRAESAPGGNVSLTSPGLDEIVSAAPAEFGGPGDRWSPETLLVAAVADCFILSFVAIARASKLSWSGLRCGVTGTLDKVDGRMRFTHFELSAELDLPAGGDQGKGERLLHKAEDVCLITNSLSATTALTIAVGSE